MQPAGRQPISPGKLRIYAAGVTTSSPLHFLSLHNLSKHALKRRDRVRNFGRPLSSSFPRHPLPFVIDDVFDRRRSIGKREDRRCEKKNLRRISHSRREIRERSERPKTREPGETGDLGGRDSSLGSVGLSVGDSETVVARNPRNRRIRSQ